MASREHSPTWNRTSVAEEVLAVLADAHCRQILHLISNNEMTAAEIADASEMPLSTVYRKLDRLGSTNLVESTYRLSSEGRKPREFHCGFDQIRVQMSDEQYSNLDVVVS